MMVGLIAEYGFEPGGDKGCWDSIGEAQWSLVVLRSSPSALTCLVELSKDGLVSKDGLGLILLLNGREKLTDKFGGGKLAPPE
jgi:hypothetical protein